MGIFRVGSNLQSDNHITETLFCERWEEDDKDLTLEYDNSIQTRIMIRVRNATTNPIIPFEFILESQDRINEVAVAREPDWIVINYNANHKNTQQNINNPQ